VWLLAVVFGVLSAVCSALTTSVALLPPGEMEPIPSTPRELWDEQCDGDIEAVEHNPVCQWREL
jgi:hypothetical protein